MGNSLTDLALLEELLGQMLSYKKIAQAGADALRKQHPRAKTPTGAGAQILSLEASVDCWDSAARLVAEALRRKRGT